jgi:signal transduction histidine kinase
MWPGLGRVTIGSGGVTTIASTATPSRKLYRGDDKVVAGVAAGLAEHLGLDARLVRLAFVVLTPAGGFGALLYIAFWAFVPQRTGTPAARPAAPRAGREPRANLLLPLAALLVGGLLLLRYLGLDLWGRAFWPLVGGGLGLALVWREADDAQRSRLSQLSSRTARLTSVDRRVGVLRVTLGALLLLAGVTTLVAGNTTWNAVLDGFLAAAVVVAGLLLIFGPWWWRLVQELAEERRERVRSQERVEVATHVHDSVLHTLALIQRHADDPREVSRLARGQERELRRWLYRPPTAEGEPSTLAAALESAAADVEDLHAVTVEVVVVGDCPVDEPLGALVAAAREAMVNAAKHAGTGQVAVYGEVEPDRVSVFVRDRGRGFDPSAVPADRYGIAESVVGRMRRHGGTATVVSAPGTGAEVQLEMARVAG